MIQMGMGKQNSVNGGRVKGEGFTVSSVFISTLKDPAIHQQFASIMLNEIIRSGHLSGGSVNAKSHLYVPLSDINR